MAYVTEENLTDVAMDRWSQIADPRLKEIMTAMVKHVHAFVREIEPTGDEWMTAIDFLSRTGHLCSGKRQEFILFSDVLGVSMLMDAINNRRANGATPSTVEGPFHVVNAPEVEFGGSMAKGAPGIPCFVTGTVTGLDGKPVANAVLDLWQTDGEGLYEVQRDNADASRNVNEAWMRGLYRTKADGSYAIRTVAPVAYTIPMDGTIGELMNHTDISHMRPAHIHFCIEAPGFHRLVTHLFKNGDEFLETDVVYGVKKPLIVDFKQRPPGKAPTGETIDEPFFEVHYDFVLEPAAMAAQQAAE